MYLREKPRIGDPSHSKHTKNGFFSFFNFPGNLGQNTGFPGFFPGVFSFLFGEDENRGLDWIWSEFFFVF